MTVALRDRAGHVRPSEYSSGRSWHSHSPDDAAHILNTSPSGLSESEAAARLEKHGPNSLAPPKRRGAVVRFLEQFNNVLIYVLLAAAVVAGALGHWIDAQVILGVVLVNAIVGYLQEGKAEKALEAIRSMLAPTATVVRSGRRRGIPCEDVVPGDAVLLEAGDRVPADLRLVETRGLTIDEAVLTGESLPVEKSTAEVMESVPLGDRTCMAFSGTLVTYGQGKGVVVATGEETEIGRISGLLTEVTTLQTPLLRQMNSFAKWLTAAILGFGVFVLAFGLLVRDYTFGDLFMAVVGLVVAAIPEGLPAVLTITLAIGVQNMARQNVIVRRLPAIETLGSVSVICSDKTGTLTRNEMAVASVATVMRRFSVDGVGYAPEGRFSVDGENVDARDYPLLTEIAQVALLCSDAALRESAGHWVVEGDPMEGALVAAACKAGLDPTAERRSWPRTDAIPFDSRHQYMASLNHADDGTGLIVVKGAPERIFEMCSLQRSDDGDVAIDSGYWLAQADAMADKGERILALAAKRTGASHRELTFEEAECGLTLLGLVGLIDPPREDSLTAVAECQAAGIQVKMITGDHAGTAAAIARQLGLANAGAVLLGRDLDVMEDEELRRRVRDTAVFARTTPAQKLRLVQALQANESVVAMTGDGVNDAPALKRADVGVSMGRKGSEAAKEAAEIVLTDDNFVVIADAVRAGRTVYDNLKKAILFILPTSGGEALVMIGAILLGYTLPITPVQILWVNMVTTVTLGLALAFEPSEPGVMRRPPRAAGEAILSGFLVWRTVFVSALFMAIIFAMFLLSKQQGATVEEARTIVVNTLVVLEIFYLFNVRYLRESALTWQGFAGTPAVLAAVAVVVGLQFVFTFAPFMDFLFAARPVSVLQGLQVVGAGVGFLLILELEKYFFRMLAQDRRRA